ncbi:MAG: hypothetical protein HY778_00085 [Betaproteobacteria bacterium]|nr:hypothetical protein [Betaproteobacteria bacterium]
MTPVTERIPLLVSSDEKLAIMEKAKSAGVSTSEFLRRAAAAYRQDEDDEFIDGLLAQVAKTTAQAEAAIDDALAFVEASNRRIADMEAARRAG